MFLEGMKVTRNRYSRYCERIPRR